MQQANLILVPLVVGVLAGLAALGGGVYLSTRVLGRARAEARRLLADAEREAEAKNKELLVAAQERVVAFREEADKREGELEERENLADDRARNVEREASRLGQQRKQLDQKLEALAERETELEGRFEGLEQQRRSVDAELSRVAGLTREQARQELVAGVEHEAREDAARLARKIEEEARQSAEGEARNMILQAFQRVNLRDVLESTVSFIELPSDEMKGRIIGKEGRNIRALEMATGIDLIVDDTPRSIWISCFDPLRREIARVAIDQLLEDGRIHPARIEEVVQRVTEEMDGHIEDKGSEAAFSLGISDLNPRLVRLVGKLRYHTSHGQNLLQHALETAMLAGFMAQEIGARVDVALRAGLLHEIGHVAEDASGHAILNAAELCAKNQQSEDVVYAIRSLHADVQATSVEALLLSTANKLSELRPGARKENLSVFIERLRRLEAIACGFPGVEKAYAVKAGRELRVIVDVSRTRDDSAYKLSRQIARALERDVSYPGQIKVCVVRETRAVRFAV